MFSKTWDWRKKYIIVFFVSWIKKEYLATETLSKEDCLRACEGKEGKECVCSFSRRSIDRSPWWNVCEESLYNLLCGSEFVPVV